MSSIAKNNVFMDFGIDVAFFEEEKQKNIQSFFENINWNKFTPDVRDLLKNALESGKIDINIPKEVVDALKKGKDYLENLKTKKLPQINIKSEDGTIIKSIDLANYKELLIGFKSYHCIYALSALAICYAFNDAINGIYERIDTIIRGLQNDRYGKCLSAVNSYNVICDEKAARDSFNILNEGLIQLHLNIREEAEVICTMPKNDAQAFWRGLTRPFSFKPKENDKKIVNFINSIIAYGTFLSFEDFLLVKISPEEAATRIEESHKKYENLLKSFENNIQLKERLMYITSGDMPVLYGMLQSNKTMSKILSLNL